MVKKYLIIAVLCLLLLPSALALDRVIVNSHDWKDVYSGMLYATLEGVPSNFLVSQKHANILLYSIPTSEEEQFVVSSRQQPYFVGYESFLKAKGYESAEELVTRNANLDLAVRLGGVTNYIVIDPAYGYNAISAAPYAAVSRSYVLFADRRNIDNIVDFLASRAVDELILFGNLDRDVKDELAQFNPEVINEGDRFSNNLVMVDKYQEFSDAKQIILTNGEFIEAGMMSGDDPVVFIGKANVPESVRDYIQASDVEVGILIGNELIGTATIVRRQLGISVFVKFAQGARTPKGAIAQVEDLDRFPMPLYNILLEITSVVYNKATRSLEVTYRNPQDLALNFKSTITINGGELPIILGDNDPLFLDKGGYKTVVYSVDTDGNPLVLDDGDYIAELFTIYGEGPRSLDQALQGTFPIQFIEVMDDAQINITGLYYDKSKGQFIITIRNTGDVDVYVQPELVNLLINDEYVTVAADEVVRIPAGGEAKVPVTIELEEPDFEENPTVKVRAYYGEREIALVKIQEKTFPFVFGGSALGFVTNMSGGTATIIVIVLIVLVLLWFLGTKKKCKHCGHKNARGRKTCRKCHKRL
ncbi:hypothetical protein GOV07_02585 [Candidatus Woesearchaeota archaeon]|nr:hypothetical protein [Candidatus Woesearchaeota archaeon]